MKQKKIVIYVSRYPGYSETFIMSKFEKLTSIFNVILYSAAEQDSRAEVGINLKAKVRFGHAISPRWKPVVFYPFLLLRSFLMRPFKTIRYFIKGINLCGISILKKFYFDCELILISPDLIHFEFGALAVGKTYLKEILNCKIAVSFRGYDINFSGLEDPAFYKDVWLKADAVHVLGQDLWKRALKRGCPPEMRHFLIPPAIDLNFFDILKVPPQIERENKKNYQLLCVGRLEWKKGYEFTFKALQILKTKGINFKCRIVGIGEYLEALTFCRHQLGLEQEIVFLGKIGAEEVRREMLKADIFIHGAVSEGFCNAVLEAQAMEIPVVTTDADGLAENIENDVTGFVVGRRDPEAMAEKILKLIQNPEMAINMGKKGRCRIIKYFKIENQIESFKKFYENI